jgi:SAM-dependent methyltransferase
MTSMSGVTAHKGEAAGGGNPPQPSWKERFVAWWEGYELPRSANVQPDEDDADASVPEVAGEPTTHSWPEERLEVVQQLFGPGFTWPASEDFLDAIIKPLGLDGKASVITFCAGLGGLARHTAKSTGAWVKGIETDKTLAEAGAELSEIAGLTKRAPIVYGDLTAIDARDEATDAVIANTVLYTVADAAPVLAEIRRVLKANGRVTVVDYFRSDQAEDSDAYRAWAAGEARTPRLCTMDEMRDGLTAVGFKVSIAEDVTGQYRDQILIAFSTFYEYLRGQEFDANLNKWALSEGELWKRRIAAIDAGVFKVYRLYGQLT